MFNALAVVVAIGAVGSLLLSAIGAYIAHRNAGSRLWVWLVCWVAFAVGSTANGLATAYDEPSLLLISALTTSAFGVCLVYGSSEIVGIRPRWVALYAGVLAAAASVVLSAILIVDPSRLTIAMAILPTGVFWTTTSIVSGVRVLRHRTTVVAGGLLGGLVLVFGLHTLDYPLLSVSPTGLAIGFGISNALLIGIQATVLVHFATIRERQRADSLERLDAIVRSLDDLVVVVDREGAVVSVHGAWSREPNGGDAYIGRNAIDLVGEDEGRRHRLMLQRVLNGEHVTYEWTRGVGADEQVIQMSLVPLRSHDGTTTGAVGLGRDVTQLIAAQADLKNQIDENRTLVHEIHHRVKNNMQVVSSLLALRSDRTQDAEAQVAFDETAAQVGVMAKVHESLYRSRHLSKVDVRDFLGRVVDGVRSGLGATLPQVATEVSIDQIVMPIDLALPIGQIVHELVNNSYKHAFEAARGGLVSVHVALLTSRIVITIEDDGCGVAEGSEPGLGTTLISALSRQIDAECTTSSAVGKGTAVRLEVPVDPGVLAEPGESSDV